jgi:two-component system, sensor histidine kinase
MIEKIRNNYLLNKTQIIVLDKQGLVLESDNLLFLVDKKTPIQEIHPFFETAIHLLKQIGNEHTFNCVHLEIGEKTGTYDIVLNTGSKTENAFLILFDFTEHYNSFQSIAQERNESILSFHLEELKNKQLEVEKLFKNNFLANISHDLRTPISAMLGFLELLENSSLNFNQKDILKTILQTGSHLKGIVDDLLDIAKIESGEFNMKIKTFDFNDFTNQIEKIYLVKATAKNLDLHIQIDNQIPKYLMGDRVRLFQLIGNMLDNAIKFTEKGEVKLIIKQNFRRADNLGLNIQVIDTGIGFYSKNKDVPFESFTKLHQEDIDGLGLGLSIVRKIVNMMKGTIKLKSVLKKGTEIEANIPLKIDLEISAKKKKLEPVEFLGSDFRRKYNVLVVDNNEINQLLLMKILVNHGGFYVDIAENGKHAIEQISNNDYDLVLMDIDMPVMGGIEASIAIKSSEIKSIAKLPIITLSANPTDDEKKRCKEAGIKQYVARPHTREELFTAIYKILKIQKS